MIIIVEIYLWHSLWIYFSYIYSTYVYTTIILYTVYTSLQYRQHSRQLSSYYYIHVQSNIPCQPLSLMLLHMHNMAVASRPILLPACHSHRAVQVNWCATRRCSLLHKKCCSLKSQNPKCAHTRRCDCRQLQCQFINIQVSKHSHSHTLTDRCQLDQINSINKISRTAAYFDWELNTLWHWDRGQGRAD